MVRTSIKPDFTAVRGDHRLSSFVRACLATGLAALDRDLRPSDVAKRWDNSRNIEMILRAAVSPTTTNTAPLTQIGVAFLDALVPISAGAELLNRGIQLSFSGTSSITVPAIALPVAGFVGEGHPIPAVTAPTSAGPTMTPHLIKAIALLTGEVMRSSNAETLVRQVLIEATGPALDKVLLSTSAATPDAPAGLLNGIAPLGAAAATADKAIVDDLQVLATAIAPVAGNSEIVVVASTDAAVALALRMPSRLTWPVLASVALAPRTVIAIAANALVAGVEGAPAVEASQFASVHRETVPGEIVDLGGVFARPVASVFQSDLVSLKLRWPLSWALRDPRSVSWMTGVNW
jgi:hypothetical protein